MLSAPAGLLLASAANAQDPTRQPRARKGQIVVGLSQEPTVFNPLMPRLEVDQGVWFALFSPLWHAQPDGTFVAELASEVPSLENGGISADGLSWRIKLRGGVTWHDGAAFTAEDVKYTLELLNNPSFRAISRVGHSLVRDITVHRPLELSWTMTRAYAPYIALLASMFIVPKHVLATAPDPNTAPFNSAPISTGPFKWEKRVAGQGVTVVANPDYFGEGPYVERVLFNYVPDLNTMYTQFKTGQIDHVGLYGIPSQYHADARKLADRKLHLTEIAQIEGIALNFGRPIFQDKAVRRAMYFGMNKKALVDLVYYGVPSPTESILSRTSWAFDANLPQHVYDLAAGNKELDEAGWVRGPDGVRTKAGLRLAFNAGTASGSPQREQVLQLLQQDWQKLGIAMQIRTMPAAVIFGDCYSKSQFDCLLLGTIYDTGADPDASPRFSSTAIPVQGGSGLNYYQYKNPEVDSLLLTAQGTFDQGRRKSAYLRVQELLRDDLAILPLCQPAPLEGSKAKLMGFRSNPSVSSNCWNIRTWHWA